MRSPMRLYCILCVITQGWNRMGQTTTNMPHALGGITMRQTGSHQNEGNFLYFRKYRTKVLLLVCIFSKMSFSYSCIWSVFFLISFVWQRYWMCACIFLCVVCASVLYCWTFVLFFLGQILRGKYFVDVYLLTLFINIDGLVHVCYVFDFGSLTDLLLYCRLP